MKSTILPLLAVGMVLCYCSCVKNNKEDLLAQQGLCDTSSISFATDIRPIIDGQCATAGCHNATTMAAGYDLETFSNLQTAALGSRFLGTIRHENGFAKMPKNLGQLDDCSIQKIVSWVNNGAQNN